MLPVRHRLCPKDLVLFHAPGHALPGELERNDMIRVPPLPLGLDGLLHAPHAKALQFLSGVTLVRGDHLGADPLRYGHAALP